MIDLGKNLSVVTRRTKSSVIRELLKLTNQPGIISFAGGLPDSSLFPSEKVADIVGDLAKKFNKAELQYGPTEGMPQLKEELVKLLEKDDGIKVKPENILITTASQQGLDLIGRGFIDPSDPILVELPSYLGGLQVFQSYGANIIGVKCDDDGILIDELEKKLDMLVEEDEHYKFIYVVPDFQNPSGVTTSQERRKKLVEFSDKYNVLVVEDSPYRQVRFEGTAPDMIYKLDHTDNVVSLFTFSKTFAPGLRLGYMVAHEEIIKKMVKLKQSLDLCTSTLNQLIAAEFLRQGYFHDHVNSMITVYKNKRDAMLHALEEYMPKGEGISWTRPEGGLFLWVRLPETLSANEMFYDAVEQKVAYVIGSAFHCDGSGTNTMRLNFSYPSVEQIDTGIKRLAEVIKKELSKKSVRV
ncbi:MAG: PLP-dependent aminotransferase family protein [Cyanobacteriota bacterium]